MRRPAGARAGFVVGKAVGNSVVRHRVTRRLRAVVRDELHRLPADGRPGGPGPPRGGDRASAAAAPRSRPPASTGCSRDPGARTASSIRRRALPGRDPASTRGRSAPRCRPGAASTRPAAPTPPRRSSGTAPRAAAGWRCAGWSSARPGTPAASTSSPEPRRAAGRRTPETARPPVVEHCGVSTAAPLIRPPTEPPRRPSAGRTRSPPLLDWLYTAISWVMARWHSLWISIFGDPTRAGLGIAWVLSIVFLVVTIRLLLFPLFVKQVKSQRAMQELQPEIAEAAQAVRQRPPGHEPGDDGAAEGARGQPAGRLPADPAADPGLPVALPRAAPAGARAPRASTAGRTS